MKPIDELIQICKSSKNTDLKLEEIKKVIEEKEFEILTDFDGRTPLHFLASRSNIEGIEYLLKHMPDLDINHKDDMGWTALSNACYLGTVSMITHLLARGANASIVDFGGKTLLHLVAGNPNLSPEGRTLAFRALESHGVKPGVKDLRGNIYTDLIVFHQATDLVKDRVDPFGRTLLHWAAYAFDAYKTYYETCIDLIGNVDDVGRTPLMYAAGIPKPNINYFDWLIVQGCSVTKQDKGGKTALHFAASCGNEEVVKRLIANGADPWILDNMGQSAIDIAERYAPQILPALQDQSLTQTLAA
jgi:ankyrin repeat protein